MRDDQRKPIADDIRMYGQHLMAVCASPSDPPGWLPFIYTIGNHERGLPELLIVGETSKVFADILNILGRLQRERGCAFRHGELVDYTAQFPAKLVEAGPIGITDYALWAADYYGLKKLHVQQVLLSDGNGRYPGDPHCLAPWRDQPVLYKLH